MNKNTITLKYLILFILITITQISSSEIYITDNLLENYNYAQEINLSFEIKQSIPTMDFVEAGFICNDNKEIIFKEFISFQNTNTHTFNKNFLTLNKGECLIEINYKNLNQQTKKFNVSSELQAQTTLNSKVFLPQEKITINWTIKKHNTKEFNYDIEIELNQTQITKQNLNKTNSQHTFTLNDNIKSGEYNLKINFIEKNIFGEQINSATITEKITVLPKPTNIEIQTTEEFKPPYDLKIKATLLDQSNNPIPNETIIIKIFDKNNNLFKQTTTKSQTEQTINFQGDSEIGGWKINAFFAEITSTKPIYIQENKQIEIKIENQTNHITIKNIGNIEYKGIIEIKLQNNSGKITQPININLKKGEQKNFPLEHSGEFNLSANGQNYKNILITGAAISTKKTTNYIIILATIIIIILLFLYIKKKRKQSKTNEPNNSGILLSNKRKIKFTWPKKNKKENIQQRKINREEINKIIKNNKNNKNNKDSIFERLLTQMQTKKEQGINNNKIEQGINNNKIEQGINNNKIEQGINNNKIEQGINNNKKLKQLKVYGLFFKKDETEKITELFKKYKLSLYKSNNLRFTLIKSTKDLNEMLIRIAKIITKKTNEKNIILHQSTLEETKKLSSHFNNFNEILNLNQGIIATNPFYLTLQDKSNFNFLKNIIYENNYIKLYKIKE